MEGAGHLDRPFSHLPTALSNQNSPSRKWLYGESASGAIGDGRRPPGRTGAKIHSSM